MEFWSQILQANKTLLFGLACSMLALVPFFTSKWQNKKVNTFMDSIPGPTTIPLLGSVHCFLVSKSESLFDFLLSLALTYPHMGRFWIIHIPYIFTGDRQIINAVLNSSQNVHKPRDYDHFKVFGNGIFNTNGPEWHKMRKIINPSFRSDVLASFGAGFSYHTNIYLESLQKYADAGRYFDLLVPTHLCTIAFVCENIMGCRKDVQIREKSHLSTNMVKAAGMVYERAFSFLLWPDLIYFLIGKQQELDAATSTLRVLAAEMLELKLNQRNALGDTKLKSENNRQTFMEALINQIETGEVTKHRTLAEIVETLTAGSITTAAANSWALKILAMRPDIQQKVYEEIVEIVGRREILLEDISKLVYLDMVIKETLRHFAVPFVGRHLVEDIQVDEKTTIPKGIRILMGPYILHHDPEYWERPGEFYPEHFSPENERKRPKGCFLPFLSGPRVCPGNKYAMQSMKLLLANAVLNFDFSTEESMPVDFRQKNYKVLFMLFPKSGFHVCVKKRSETELNHAEDFYTC